MLKKLILSSGVEDSERYIDIVTSINPFGFEKCHAVVPSGLTITEILDTTNADKMLLASAYAFDGDYLVPHDKWETYKPKTDLVTFRVVPHGGGEGEKSGLRIVLAVVVLAIAIFAPPLLGVAAGVGATLLSGVIGIAGMVAVNALVPIPAAKLAARGKDHSRSLSLITGSRNEVRQFGVIPRVLGKVRMVPPYAAPPYSVILAGSGGEDLPGWSDLREQFIKMIYLWGYGPLDISEIKVGETSIDEFVDKEIVFHDGSSVPAFELYTNQVFEEHFNVLIDFDSGYITRTTQTNTDEIGVDIHFPGLGRVNSAGELEYKKVEIQAQYRATGTSDDWLAVTSGQSFLARTLEAKEGLWSIYEAGRAPVPQYRGDSVLLNKSTGSVILRKGRVQTSPTLGSADFHGSRWFEIAQISRSSSSIVTDDDITDKRAATYPFDDNDIETEWSGTDFAVTATDPPSSNLNIAAGTLYSQFLAAQARSPEGTVRSFFFKPPEQGQFDVRVKRITADATGANTRDLAYLSAIRSITYETPVTKSGLALTEVEIKATSQLQGVVDEFNAVVISIVKDWDVGTSTWIERPTNNPASLLREVLQGSANALAIPDARLDLAAFQDFHEFCASKEFSFGAVYDFPSSISEVLKDVASSGRGSISIKDGKWSVIWDDVRTVPVQHFSPRNSWDYSAVINYPDLPHALKVRFLNREKGYAQDEFIVYRTGYDENTATLFEEMEFPGVTNEEHVWALADYFIASASLRLEQHTFSADIEHIVCTRGDLIQFAHDVPSFGLANGRIKTVTLNGVPEITGITVDEPCSMEDGKTYVIRVREADGDSFTAAITTDAGSQTSLTLATPAAGGVAAGDLFLFGETGIESAPLIVQSVRPSYNLNAEITCINYAPGVYTAGDGGDYPGRTSYISPVPGLDIPAILSTRSDEFVLVRNADGSLQSRIVVAVGFNSNQSIFIDAIQARFREVDSGNPFIFTPDISPDSTTISLSPVVDGVTFEFQLRYRLKNSSYGAWSTSQTHTVIGKANPPADVTGFASLFVSNGVELSWNKNEDPDISHYEIREGSSWELGAVVVSQVGTTHFLVNQFTETKTFRIKAVDTTGNESASDVSLTASISAPSGLAISLEYVGQDFMLTWTVPTGQFPISYYEIRSGGSSWADASVVASEIATTNFRHAVTWEGSEVWRVKAYDSAGNVSDEAIQYVVPTAPTLSTLTDTVIDNQVLIVWTTSAGSLPATTYNLYKGAVFGSSVLIATIQATAYLQLETAGGDFVYWVEPVDSAGNKGTALSTSARVNDPPDFTFINTFKSDFETSLDSYSDVFASGTHHTPDIPENWIVGPCVVAETITERLTDNSWATPQAQVSAGYTYFAQTGESDGEGTWCDEYDLGSVISEARIVLSKTETALVGSPTFEMQFSVKEDSGDSWTDFTVDVDDVVSNDFRYIKLCLWIKGAAGTDFGKIENPSVSVSVKEITDQGSTVVASAGTVITTNKTFLVINSVTATPEGTSSDAFFVIAEKVSDTSIKLFVKNSSGSSVDGATVNWILRGI